MFNFLRFKESRRKRKEYTNKLNEIRAEFRKTILETPLGRGDKIWYASNLWSTAVLVEEAETLSRLTRWLIVLSIVLSVLTLVLAFSTIGNFLAWLSRAEVPPYRFSSFRYGPS